MAALYETDISAEIKIHPHSVTVNHRQSPVLSHNPHR